MAKKETSKKNNGMSGGQAAAMGVGLTAAAVAAAGAYFLYGSKSAPKNRKVVKSWALKAKGEVLEALEKAEAMTEKEYKSLVDVIAGTYAIVQGATRGEISDFRKEMKDHWAKIEKSAVANKAKNVAKSAAKHVATKAVVKAAGKAVGTGGPAKKAASKPKAAPKKASNGNGGAAKSETKSS